MMLTGAVALSSCEKDETENDESNNEPTNNSNLANNTLKAGSESVMLNLYTAHRSTDVNTNKEYIDIYIFKDNAANRANYLQIALNEIPSATKELSWQSGSSAPGDLTPDEFVIFPKVNDMRWYGVYSTTGFETTGKMQAEVDGSKLILSFKDIELADNFISTNVSQTEKVSGKFTFNLPDLQNLGTRPSSPKNLVD